MFLSADSDVVASLVRQLILAVRAVGSSPFVAALSSRTPGERNNILDKLFQRLETQVLNEPTHFQLNCPLVHMVMQKNVKKRDWLVCSPS